MAPADSPNTVTSSEAAERSHVVANPFQGRDLVAETEVGRGAVQDGEPGDAEPVVDRHQHDAIAGERGPVVGGN